MKPSPFEAREAKGAQPTWVVGAPVLPESRIGTVIEREYQVRAILSQGELGVTYQVFNTRLKSFFNVLFLDRELAPTHEMMLAVRADLGRARDLQALGLMPIRQITDDLGVPGFATERLDGESLRQRVARGSMPVAAALALALHLAKALDAAHRAGLIHGDLRPENVFLVRPGAKGPYAARVMLLEHSLRHLRRRPPGFDDSLPLGKLRYRPPEQVAGLVLSADPGGDIFVLGALLYECLTGQPAFAGEDVEAVLDNLSRPPPRLKPNPATGLTAGLAEALSVVVTGCCAPDPQARVPSVTDLQRALEQVVSGAGLTLPATVCENPPAAAAPGRVKGLLQRLSGAFQAVSLEAPVVVKPAPEETPAKAAEAAGARAKAAEAAGARAKAAPAPADGRPADPVTARAAVDSASAPQAPAAVAGKPPITTAAPPPAESAKQPPTAAPAPPAAPDRPEPALAPREAEPARPAAGPPVSEPAAGASQPVPPRGTLSMLIREGQVSMRRPTPIERDARPAAHTLQGMPKVEALAAPAAAASPEPPATAAQSRALTDRTTRSLPLIEQVRQVRERFTAGHAIIDPNQDVINERPTRSLRARDITQLVAAVQQGTLAADQAVELAQIPEELPLSESDLLTSGDGAAAAPPPQPAPPQQTRSDPYLAPAAPIMPQLMMPPMASGPGMPVQLPLPVSPSSPTRRARSSVRPVPRPQISPAKRFLLQHQELVAAALGAAVMLLLGLILMQCR